jgi:hypothetical protein
VSRQHRHHRIAAERETVLFLSLEHGNEPMGLLALLWTAYFVLLPESTSPAGGLRRKSSATRRREASTRSLSRRPMARDAPRVVFFPFVNVDAYELNVQLGNGCRRSNLRHTCDNETESVFRCPKDSLGGVDLNVRTTYGCYGGGVR